MARGERYPQRVNWRLTLPITGAVIVIWLVGAAVTKYSLEQMAYLAPVAVVVVGATVGLVLLWENSNQKESSSAPPSSP